MRQWARLARTGMTAACCLGAVSLSLPSPPASAQSEHSPHPFLRPIEEQRAAVALYFAWALAGPDGTMGFAQEDGYWRLTHNRLVEFFPDFLGEDVVVRPNETICDAPVGDLQTCTIQAGIRQIREPFPDGAEGGFMTRPLKLTFSAEAGAPARVTEVCEVYVDQCADVPPPAPELVAAVFDVLEVAPPAEAPRALPQVDHIDFAAFEPRAHRLQTGASIPVLAILNPEIGYGFGDQGLRPPFGIREVFRFGETAVTDPEEMLRLFAEIEEGTPLGVWIIDLDGSGSNRIDVVRRSQREFDTARDSAGQWASLETDSVFDTEGFIGLRLELMRRGYFDILETVIEADADTALDELGPVGALVELVVPGVAGAVASGRYGGLALLYGLMRYDMLGACGEPVTQYRQTREITWELQNVHGIRQGAPWRTTDEWDFDLPRVLSSIAEREQNLVFPPSQYGAELRVELRRLTCDSAARRALEENFVAFYFRRSPAVVHPFEPRPAWPLLR